MGESGVMERHRPWTVQVYVAIIAVAVIYSAAVQPGRLNLWNVVFTLFFLGLLKQFWEGERAMWLLFLIVSLTAAAVGAIVAVDDPPALGASAAAVLSACLLLLRQTKEWFTPRG
jgi:hypothetical protein